MIDMMKRIHPLYIASFLYMILSFVLGLYLLNGLVVFLGWNMVLATMVLFWSDIMIWMQKRKTKPIWILGVLLLYVLFFPNSIYIITDFIHFQVYDFFLVYPSVYVYDISDWLVMGHVTIGALLAAKIGVTSLCRLERAFLRKMKNHLRLALIAVLFLASSVGIYIGRFLRFNSWDILRFFDMIAQIFDQIGFFIPFVIMFFVIHWVSYLLFAHRTNIVV